MRTFSIFVTVILLAGAAVGQDYEILREQSIARKDSMRTLVGNQPPVVAALLAPLSHQGQQEWAQFGKGPMALLGWGIWASTDGRVFLSAEGFIWQWEDEDGQWHKIGTGHVFNFGEDKASGDVFFSDGPCIWHLSEWGWKYYDVSSIFIDTFFITRARTMIASDLDGQVWRCPLDSIGSSDAWTKIAFEDSARAWSFTQDHACFIYMVKADVGVFRSRNNGVTWELLNAGLEEPDGAQVLGTNGDQVFLGTYTHDDAMYRLSTGDTMWTHIPGSPSFRYGGITARGDTVVADGIENTYWSVDGGNTWSLLYSSPHFERGSTAAAIDQQGRVFILLWLGGVKLYDGIFTDINDGLPAGPVNDVVFDSRSGLWLAATDSYGSLQFLDRQKGWLYNDVGRPSGTVSYVFAENARGQLLLGDHVGVYRVNADATINLVQTEPSPDDKSYFVRDVIVLDSLVVMGYRYGVKVSRSHGGDGTWRQISDTLEVECVSLDDAGGLYVGAREGVFFTPDLGVTWKQVGEFWPDDILFVGGLLYATLYYDGVRIWDGSSWSTSGGTDEGGSLMKVGDRVVWGAESGRVYSAPIGTTDWRQIGTLPAGVNRLRVIDGHLYACTGQGVWRAPLGVVTGVKSSAAPVDRPERFSLAQNYPNPFNPSTSIEFALPKASFVTLKIYDVLGNEVATLVSENLPSGQHQRVWEATGLASGVYLYRLQAGDFVKTRRLLYIR